MVQERSVHILPYNKVSKNYYLAIQPSKVIASMSILYIGMSMPYIRNKIGSKNYVQLKMNTSNKALDKSISHIAPVLPANFVKGMGDLSK